MTEELKPCPPKGKIPIITSCHRCQFLYTFKGLKKCGLTHKESRYWYAAEIPDWCPLPDADGLLEKKGTINDEGN